MRETVLVRNGQRERTFEPDEDPRVVRARARVGGLASEEFRYVRVLTRKGNIAWSSPVWGDEL